MARLKQAIAKNGHSRLNVLSKRSVRAIEISVQTVTTCIALVLSFGCHNSTAKVPSAPSPAASTTSQQPSVAYFNAEPQILTAGQSSSLRWSIVNATNIEITPAIGPVQANDGRVISPPETTTYTLKASNVAGAVEASVTVTVSRPPPPVSSSKEDVATGVNLLNEQLRDVHFDYNEAEIKEQERAVLEADANLLINLFRLDADAHVTVEGHCDDRGSDAYNIALGDSRAAAVKQALVRLGVPAEKLDILSYGEEHPLCVTPTEQCYARNRRAHFAASHTRTRTASLPQ